MRYYLSLLIEPNKLYRHIRMQWLKIRGMTIGSNVTIKFPLHYRFPKRIHISDGAVIGEYTFLVAGRESFIFIGEDVLLAPHVHINCTSHNLHDSDLTIKHRGGNEKFINILKGSWLGTGVVVLQGITIGDNSVIGALSLVNKDIPAGVVAVGNPARVIKR